VLEHALHGDVALVKAERGDAGATSSTERSARNFGPTMASRRKCTIAQVYETVELGALDPECIVRRRMLCHGAVVKVPRKSKPREVREPGGA